MNPPRPLAAGDVVPRIGLLNAAGAVVELDHQSTAGNALVLWLCGPAARPAPGFAAPETLLYAVVASAPAAVEGAVLFDPENRMAAAFGLGGPAIVVIDAGRHVAAILPDGDFTGAAQVCARLHAATGTNLVTRQAPVLVIPDVLEPALCAALIAYWEGGEKRHDGVAAQAARDYADPGIKKRTDVGVVDPALIATLQDRVNRRIVPEVAKAFRRPVRYLESFRIGCYDADSGGYFRRHRDNTTRYTAHRLFAVTLNLNTGQYQGGALRFPEYGRMPYAPAAGGAVVFSCALLHEALPVTAGRRFGLFTFMHDEEGERAVQRLIAEEHAAGRTGLQLQPAR